MKQSESTSENLTVASVAHERLRADIISGALTPGDKLKVKELCSTYGIGITPAREALNRLAVEGLAVQLDHRGFTVALISREDLMDLTAARCAVAEVALRQSIENGDEAWEDLVIVSYQRMKRVPRFLEGDPAVLNPDWDPRHRAFHSALLFACPSKRLRDYNEQLMDQADRYRNLAAMTDVPTTLASVDAHLQIMEATVSRNVLLACQLLSQHFEQTRDMLLSKWTAAKQDAAGARRNARRGRDKLLPPKAVEPL